VRPQLSLESRNLVCKASWRVFGPVQSSMSRNCQENHRFFLKSLSESLWVRLKRTLARPYKTYSEPCRMILKWNATNKQYNDVYFNIICLKDFILRSPWFEWRTKELFWNLLDLICSGLSISGVKLFETTNTTLYSSVLTALSIFDRIKVLNVIPNTNFPLWRMMAKMS
jgi:hypothetical protein